MANSKQAKYNKEKTILLNIRLIRSTEQDLIEKLASVPNKSGYIKSLIRADIKKEESHEN